MKSPPHLFELILLSILAMGASVLVLFNLTAYPQPVAIEVAPAAPPRRYPPPDEYRNRVDAALEIGDEAEAIRLMAHADSLDILVEYQNPRAKALDEKRRREWWEEYLRNQKEIEKR